MEGTYLMDVLLMVKNDRISVEEGFRLIKKYDKKIPGSKYRSYERKGSGPFDRSWIAATFLKTTGVNRNLW